MLRKMLAAAVLAALNSINAQAAITNAGDIIFTAFNADEDGFTLTTFKDIDANTSIFFTDNEWNGSTIGAGGAFNSGESYSKWVSGANVISAGSVIRFSSVDTTSLAASYGTLTRQTVSGNTNWGLANSNETLYAYLGSGATSPATFLSAITNSDFGATDGTLANTGLTAGVDAIRLRTTGSPDFGEYNGIRSGLNNIADYKPLVADIGNWTVDTTDGVYTTTIPNTTNFTVVPVPTAAWLFGTGIAGLLASRKKSV